MKENNNNNNIRLKPVLLMMVILAVALTCVLLFAGYSTRVAYSEMQEASERYIVCQDSAQDMKDASDYLTKQVQTYAVTGDERYMTLFYKEVNQDRTRDRALDKLGTYFDGEQAYKALEKAMARSNELTQVEAYSMRLEAEAQGMAPEKMPEEVRAVQLSPQDQALSAEQKQALATDMLFGSSYESTKASIEAAVNECTDDLQEVTRQDQLASSSKMLHYLNLFYILTVALLFIVFGTFLMTTLLALKPLQQAIHRIQDKEMIPENGSYEVQFLARTYNSMLEKNKLHQDKLSYEATHDPMTKLYNRGVFEEMLPTCELQHNALMLVDLDKFKGMNDTYGHQVGDQVIQKTAKALQDSFRGEDYVCRIGGDEFAVLMVNVSPDMRDLVMTKIQQIRAKVEADDGLPPYTISVGVAFSDGEQSGTAVFKHADTALYHTKEKGGNGHTFFDEMKEIEDAE